jgi:hypothetical protein
VFLGHRKRTEEAVGCQSHRYCHVWTLPRMQGLWIKNSDGDLPSCIRPVCAVVPSINSSPLKNLSFSDTARLDEFFDHTGNYYQFYSVGQL